MPRLLHARETLDSRTARRAVRGFQLAGPSPSNEEARRMDGRPVPRAGLRSRIDRAGNVVAWPEARARAPYRRHRPSRHRARAAQQDEISFDGDGRCSVPEFRITAPAWPRSGHRPRLRSALPIKMRGRLVLVANVGEEGEGNLSGMRHLAANLRSPPHPRLSGAGWSLARTHHQPGARQPPLRGPVHRRRRPQLERLRQRQPRPRAEPRHLLVHRYFPPAANGNGPRSSFNFGTSRADRA